MKDQIAISSLELNQRLTGASVWVFFAVATSSIHVFLKTALLYLTETHLCLCSSASCLKLFDSDKTRTNQRYKSNSNAHINMNYVEEISPTALQSVRIKATMPRCHLSRVLSQSFSGLRPGSSNLLCHTGRFSYRPCHDTAATHSWETCTQASTHTGVQALNLTVIQTQAHTHVRRAFENKSKVYKVTSQRDKS